MHKYIRAVIYSSSNMEVNADKEKGRSVSMERPKKSPIIYIPTDVGYTGESQIDVGCVMHGKK
jgi:hypothetical protein